MRGDQVPLFEQSEQDRMRDAILACFQWGPEREPFRAEYLGELLWRTASQGAKGVSATQAEAGAIQHLANLGLVLTLDHPIHGRRYVATYPIRKRYDKERGEG